jgi:hypothetical protein
MKIKITTLVVFCGLSMWVIAQTSGGMGGRNSSGADAGNGSFNPGANNNHGSGNGIVQPPNSGNGNGFVQPPNSGNGVITPPNSGRGFTAPTNGFTAPTNRFMAPTNGFAPPS